MNIENDNFISLKLIGFRKHEAEKFCAILDLAEFALQPAWQIVKTATADFYVVYDKSQSAALKNLPRERCFFYVPDPSKGLDNGLLVDSDRTPSLQALIPLFNRVAQQALPAATAKTAPKAKPEQKPAPTSPKVPAPTATVQPAKPQAPAKAPEFNPQQGLLGILLTEQKQAFALTLQARPTDNPIFIYHDKKAYYSLAPLEQLKPFFSLDNPILATPLSVAELGKAVKKSGLTALPLSQLIWYAAFNLSQGQLLQGHSGQELVQLSQLPYLGKTDSLSYRKLAEFLHKNTASLEQAAEVTGTPLAVANNFYNASFVAGLFGTIPAPDKQSLFSKLKNRLKHPGA
ncbi:hypothetical protein [Methylovulum psychrotolerans]|jgi:hypothetical protein|uniref:Uncharacterized protein n=1 Tax=Methylovulum psychrotolerans TaxID=1704499 RepID=A0A2S5CSZ9_9GAMM|nr:hypothetical protein [Methylovulum psychrotolerans]POZ53950.1 hypothetical protein AADEFJLK_00992 [Methylovulum psychrotolerans]